MKYIDISNLLFIVSGFFFLVVSYFHKLKKGKIGITYGSIENSEKKEIFSIHIYQYTLVITHICIIANLIALSRMNLLEKSLNYHVYNIVLISLTLAILNIVIYKLKKSKTILSSTEDFFANINLFIIAYICSSAYKINNSTLYIILGTLSILLSLYRIYFFRFSCGNNIPTNLGDVMAYTVKTYIYFILTFLLSCNFCMNISCYGVKSSVTSGFNIKNSSGNYFLDLFVYCLSTATTVGNANVVPISPLARCLNVLLVLVGPIMIGIFINELSKHNPKSILS